MAENPVQEDWDGVEGGLINDGSEQVAEQSETPTPETPIEQEQSAEETSGETEEKSEPSEPDVDIDTLKADAAKWTHLQEVAAKNPEDFAKIVEKYFPARVNKSVNLDPSIIFNKDPNKEYTEAEILAHITEANKSMVASELEARGLGELLQQHHEQRLENEYPFYKEDAVKEAAREYQRRIETDPSGTMQEVFIKAAAFDNMGDVVEAGKKIARVTQKQKLAATGEKGVSPPQTKSQPREKEPTLEERALASISDASPWGD